jgi:hypothetical protein
VAVLHSNKRLGAVGSPDDDGFGFAGGNTHSLAVSDSAVVVGASLDSSDASDVVGDPANRNAPHSGAIYVFARQSDNTFVKESFVKPRGAVAYDHFGHSVAGGPLRVLGMARGLAANAPGVNRNQAADQPLPSPAPGTNGSLTGAALYLFEQQAPGAAWTERASIVAPNAPAADFNASYLMMGTLGFDTGVPDGTGGVARRAFVY